MDSANGDLAEAKPDAAAETVAEPPPTLAAVGEKRTAEAAAPIENAGGESSGDAGNGTKKMRSGGFTSAEEEKELRRVAEIVLVLSGLGTMRGGRDPTAVEKAMMTEARAKVVQLCQELAPRDIVPREAFGGIIEDLGLNRLKEHKSGFRPPKLSIAERMEMSKQKMAESRQLIAQAAASHSAQRPQAGMGVPPTTNRQLPSEKPSHPPSSAPGSHLSSTGSVTLSFQPSGHQFRPALMSTGLPASSLGNTPTTAAAVKFERPQQRPDGRLSGPSLGTQAPGVHGVKTPNTHLQSQSAASGNPGARNKALDHSLARPQASSSMHLPVMNPQVTHIQTMKPGVAQGVPGTIHPAVQGVHYMQTSPLLNHHIEISKMVQSFLHPKPPEHPTWVLPSREYMNKVVTCQTCKSDTNEVDSLLICDACEKGFHLKCLQIGNQKTLPRGEWHCPRCLTINKGKPFPPKYGKVTRNVNNMKVTSNASGVQPQKKPETQDQAPNLQKSVATISSNKGDSSHATGAAETSGATEKPNSDIRGTEISQGIKKEEPSISKNDSSDRVDAPGAACVDGSSKPSIQKNVKFKQSCPIENNPSNLPPADHPLKPSITNQTPSSSAADRPPGSNQSVDKAGDPSSTEVLSQNNASNDVASNGVDDSLQPPSSSNPDDNRDSSKSVDQTGGPSGTVVPSQDNANEDGAPAGVNVSLQPSSSSASDHPPGSCRSVDQSVGPSWTEAPLQNNDSDDGASSGIDASLQQHGEKNGLMKHTNSSDGNEAMDHQSTHADVEHNEQLEMKVVVDGDTQAEARVTEGGLHKVDWVGDVSEVVDNKKLYQSCCVNGAYYKVYDYVLVRSADGKLVPWKLQAMWEDSRTSIKWVKANRCYFPGDLPAEVGRPSAPESDEVYESNDESNLMAGLIQGPCEVVPVKKFGEENNGNGEKMAQESGDHPVFLCRWYYDKMKGVFRPIPS